MKGAVILVVRLAVLAALPTVVQNVKWLASLADLEEAVREDPNHAAAHHNVVPAYWNAKRWDGADLGASSGNPV